MKIANLYEDKSVLITGACGTVGQELVKQLLQDEYKINEIVCIDNNESTLFFMEQEYVNENRITFFIADVRDKHELESRFKGIDIVFHCAALKHVTYCERSPDQAVQTNINGVQNVISAAKSNNVQVVIFTSSDKAVNPTNVMGTTKLMGERLITAANSNKRSDGPIYASTRFGNVLGSSGSVIPVFKRQILSGGPVTLTDTEMTRFVMSIHEAAKLVIDSAAVARGGEVFVTKMPVIRIEDLANSMIEIYAQKEGFGSVDIEVIGAKPGEKLYEELMSPEETRRAVELKEFFSVLPAFRGFYSNIEYEYDNTISSIVDNPYVSSDEVYLSVEEIKLFLEENKLI